MARLTVTLLGEFQVRLDGHLLRSGLWPSPFAREAAQILLVRRPDWVPGPELVSLIGGEMVLADLSVAVGQARRALGPAITLERSPHGAYRAVSGPDARLDLVDFHRCCQLAQAQAARGEMQQALASYEAADRAYKGPLLADNARDWTHEPRRALGQQHLDLMGKMADTAAVLGRYPEAITYCRRVLHVDPLREETYQRAMVYAYYVGDLATVTEAYQACRRVLMEAGREASAETDMLYTRLHDGGLPAASLRQAAAAVQSPRSQSN